MSAALNLGRGCPARGCGRALAEGWVVCPDHWRDLPDWLQHRIHDALAGAGGTVDGLSSGERQALDRAIAAALLAPTPDPRQGSLL